MQLLISLKFTRDPFTEKAIGSCFRHQVYTLNLSGNNFEYLPQSIVQLGALRSLYLSDCNMLKELPDFTGMPNLVYLNLCKSRSLERFPYVNVESLKYLDLVHCYSLEKLPEFLGMLKPELVIRMRYSGIREIPSSIIHLLVTNLTKLDLSDMNNLVSLSSSICKLNGLVNLDVSFCSKLESLPEEIGDLENLKELHARDTLISQPPSSIVRLNKLKVLTFAKEKSEDRAYFVFPDQVNEGLLSLEYLDLRYCNLIDGGLPEDIGSLSSLKELNLCGNKFEHLPRSISQLGALRYLDLTNCDKLKELPGFTGMPNLYTLNLSGNNFEHLPRSIAQLGALRSLYLSDCKRLTQLLEFPQQLYTIEADWSCDWICNSLFQNMSSLQHDISVSNSLSLRVFRSLLWDENIPSWFHHQGMGASVSINLRENWYVSDNFLGFAVCYSGKLIGHVTAHLIPLCDDGMSSMTQKFALTNRSFYVPTSAINFFLVPLAGLWDASNANGKTPNDYGHFRLFSTGEKKRFGVRLLYKDEPELHIGIMRSRYEGVWSCCFPLLQLFPTRLGLLINYRTNWVHVPFLRR